MNEQIKKNKLKKIDSILQKTYNDIKLLKSLDKFVSEKKNIKNESSNYDNLAIDLKEIKELLKNIMEIE